MNLIPCDEKCKHQEEGYCALNQIARLTGSIEARCGYYEPARAGKERPSALLTENLERL